MRRTMKTIPRFFTRIVTLLAMTATLLPLNAKAAADWPIVTRRGDTLYEGDKPFRFLGIAAPNLHQNENQLHPDYSNRWPDEYEIRDTFEAMRYLGARATRTFSLSIYSPQDKEGLNVYIQGRRLYNEDALRCLDCVLALAHEYDIRLIIPLIASQHFEGWRGADEFAAFEGKPPLEGAFWTDEAVKADYKHLFSTLANRRNTVSGILYKDDPAILAWQFGNEFDVYATDNHFDADKLKALLDPWCREMAAYMKSVDPKHLVMSAGFHLQCYIEDPNIDVVSIHLYEHWNHLGGNFTDLAVLAENEWQLCKGKKPLIVDEFGMGKPESMERLMAEIRKSGITGGLIWSIRSHRRDGGWYYHNEGGSVHNSYHIPGFDTGHDYYERRLLDSLRENAWAIRGETVPPMRSPVQAPVLYPLGDGLTWRGSTLAQYYILQRASSPDGPWTTLATGLLDSQVPDALALEKSGADNPGPLYIDPSAPGATPRYYRVKGVNLSGESPWSAPLALPAHVDSSK
jgi:hypothetical protein